MKRGRPIHALGASPRKDHLFVDGTSLCEKWWYGGGSEVDEIENDDELCNTCARRA